MSPAFRKQKKRNKVEEERIKLRREKDKIRKRKQRAQAKKENKAPGVEERTREQNRIRKQKQRARERAREKNFGLAKAIEDWIKEKGLPSQAADLLRSYTDPEIAEAYMKGYNEGRWSERLMIAGIKNVPVSPGSDFPSDMDPQKRAECMLARTEGFCHAAGFVVVAMANPPRQELADICRGIQFAEVKLQNGDMENWEGVQNVLLESQIKAAEHGHGPIFNTSHAVSKKLGKDLVEHARNNGLDIQNVQRA